MNSLVIPVLILSALAHLVVWVALILAWLL
jgi:hypothetical protein